MAQAIREAEQLADDTMTALIHAPTERLDRLCGHHEDQYVMAPGGQPYLIRTSCRADTDGSLIISVCVSTAGWSRSAPVLRRLVVTPPPIRRHRS